MFPHLNIYLEYTVEIKISSSNSIYQFNCTEHLYFYIVH